MNDRQFGVLLTLTISGLLLSANRVEAVPPGPRNVLPEEAGMDPATLEHIDSVVQVGLDRGRMPGCVVMVGRSDRIVLLKAYGHRRIEPTREAMTTDTVFDLASLTKPIATATSVMALIERGSIRLSDPVAKYIPEFRVNGKDRISVQQLLTHQGGLIPDNPLRDYERGRDEALRRIYALKPRVEPGTRFIYTDVGYIVLAELVRKVTGKNIHEFSHDAIFAPLGMSETGFLPEQRLRERAATTEQRGGEWMRGEVHDPRAHRLGGIAGHAGLFSTAKDLARYATMMLHQGTYADVRILQPDTIALMTHPVRVSSGLRGLGWDIQTGYSSNRGDLFSRRAFGHGGFTGTALWVDPQLDLFVIFLSNRVHPDGKGSVNALAGRIATIAAAAIQDSIGHSPLSRLKGVLTGIDVLERNGFRRLKGRRVGLITNHTGINRQGVSTYELMHESMNVSLISLFSPEHGFAGKLDRAGIRDSREQGTGLKIFSLYGKSRTPTTESLMGIDTLIFDIQDVGSRFYTYISTMGNAMHAAAKHKIRFVVLDRPNPIGGLAVQGPVLDAGSESFVGFHQICVRHGMTCGELARMFNAELKLGLDLEIVGLQGWRRELFFDATGLRWVNPSPNMRSLTQALLYPGVGLLETTNLSVGRGTDTPFEVVGAPWINGVQLAQELNTVPLAGVRFVPIAFTPDSSKFKGIACSGVNILITNRRAFHPLITGFALAHVLRRLYPNDWQTSGFNRLLCSEMTNGAVLTGKSYGEVLEVYRAGLESFRKRRQQFLLYE